MIGGWPGASVRSAVQPPTDRAERMECAELAPAVGWVRQFKSGSKLHALHTLHETRKRPGQARERLDTRHEARLWSLDCGLWTAESHQWPRGSDEDLKLGSHIRMLRVSAGWARPCFSRMMSTCTRPLEANSDVSAS